MKKFNYDQMVVGCLLVKAVQDKELTQTIATVTMRNIFGCDLSEAPGLFQELKANYFLLNSDIFRREGDRIFAVTGDREIEITSSFYKLCSRDRQKDIDEVTRIFKNRS